MVGLIALLVSTFQLVFAGQVSAQTVTCADYSSASAAQFTLEINPNLASALDPDGNGIACDDAGSGQLGASGDRAPSDLQLPGVDEPTPTPAGQQGQTNVDAIDQQPVDGPALPTQPASGPSTGQQNQQTLDGRIGSDRAGWEAIYGGPLNEDVGSRPEIVITDSGPMPTANSFVTLWFNDQAFIILLSAETSWSGGEAASIIQELLPTDILSLPEGEVLSDGSLLIPMVSEQLAPVISAESMADAGAPGDLYLLLITDGGERAVEIEIGVGDGDNVREDIDGSTTTSGFPTPTPATTTTTGDNSSLQHTRTEVDRLLAEHDEFLAILEAGTFTDAEIDRANAILSSWVPLDTELPAAPPEYAASAAQLQQIRTDLGSAAQHIIAGLAAGGQDDATVDESLGLLDSAHASLLDLDRQLTALGV